MISQVHFVLWLICSVIQNTSCAAADESIVANPIIPAHEIHLLSGRDLSGWYTWLGEDGYVDSRQIFAMQPDGILRISGNGFGGLITHDEYANYHLVMEYRWGTHTWQSRKNAARDGGLLLHCQGPDGNFGGSDGKPGPWMTSIECQIIEGGVGDMLVLSGNNANGMPIRAQVTCEVTRDRDGEPVWTDKSANEQFRRGRINWFGRDPDWKDVLGFRGKNDIDSPGKQWTRLECVCDDDKLTYLVNGVIVNRATNVLPKQGKILIQTEGAEMFVRRLDINSLPKNCP